MTLTFNGKNIADFSATWDGSKLFDSPEKDVEFISVIGRNGDLSVSNGRYRNIEIEVPIFIRKDFKANFNALTSFLLAQDGYCRLETSEEPGTYRMAQFVRSIKPQTGSFNIAGKATLVFNCMPQKFLKRGNAPIEVSGSLVLENPSYQVALPKFEVQGTGTIGINDSAVRLKVNTGTTVIDCESEDVYEGVINRNGDVELTNGFPRLKAGENTVTASGFTRVKLYPRWWTT